ncbi:MAG: hypothetical protein P9M08_04130 [Candidatus Erginobacter occultus]|nr:hypothetical protein [Candidatus Erginobacter occultus]
MDRNRDKEFTPYPGFFIPIYILGSQSFCVVNILWYFLISGKPAKNPSTKFQINSKLQSSRRSYAAMAERLIEIPNCHTWLHTFDSDHQSL